MDDTKKEAPVSTSAPQEPSISPCRWVLYHTLVGDQAESHAAVCVHVWSIDCCNLVVYDRKGEQYKVYSVSKGGPGQPGTWSYPPRSL